VDGLWATKSEGVGLIVRAVSFQDFHSNLCDPDPPTSQTDGQTDGRMTCISRWVHSAVKMSTSNQRSLYIE